MGVSNKYDLGQSDSPYFENKNKECIEETKTYKDCNGECFSITKEVEPVYFQAREILAPVFISTTWGSEKYYKAKIKDKPTLKKGALRLAVSYPLQVLDLIKTKESIKNEYYILSKEKSRDKWNNTIILVGRTDGFPMGDYDLPKFKKGGKLFVTGFLKDNKDI